MGIWTRLTDLVEALELQNLMGNAHGLNPANAIASIKRLIVERHG